MPEGARGTWIARFASLTQTHPPRQAKARVPGIRRLRVGRNFTDRARGFTHGLVVTLDSPEALAAYQVHPIHAALAKDLRAASDDIVALDFEA